MHGAWTQNTSSPSVSRKCTQLFSRTGVTSVIWYNIAYSSLTASGLWRIMSSLSPSPCTLHCRSVFSKIPKYVTRLSSVFSALTEAATPSIPHRSAQVSIVSDAVAAGSALSISWIASLPLLLQNFLVPVPPVLLPNATSSNASSISFQFPSSSFV